MNETMITEDVMLILSIYEEDSREESLARMQDILPEVIDPIMKELVEEGINILSEITDEEYLQLDFSSYDQEIEDIIAEAEAL